MSYKKQPSIKNPRGNLRLSKGTKKRLMLQQKAETPVHAKYRSKPSVLSPKQAEVIDRMKQGWVLTFSDNGRFGKSAYLQKEGGGIKDVRPETVRILERRFRMIEPEPTPHPSLTGTKYKLSSENVLREAKINSLIERIRGHDETFGVIQGATGSGKLTLVQEYLAAKGMGFKTITAEPHMSGREFAEQNRLYAIPKGSVLVVDVQSFNGDSIKPETWKYLLNLGATNNFPVIAIVNSNVTNLPVFVKNRTVNI